MGGFLKENMLARLEGIRDTALKIISDLREPVHTHTLEEFMSLVDRKPGSIIHVIPEEIFIVFHNKNEDFGPSFSQDDLFVGVNFGTRWRSKEPAGRSIEFYEHHQTLDQRFIDKYNETQIQWVMHAEEHTKVQQGLYPDLIFMLQNPEG